MSEWICEVLSYASMASYDQPITAGDGLKRVFSVLSSGVAINGIKDPTNENKNIFESFTKQELLEISVDFPVGGFKIEPSVEVWF